MAGVAARLLGALASYDALMKTVDPEEEPYRSKYQAREDLLKFITELESTTSEGASGSGASSAAGDNVPRTDAEPLLSVDALAICRCKLGINFLLTEENTAAEAPLLSTANHVSSAVLASSEAAAALPLETLLRLVCTGLEASNYLALLYSGWDSHAKALERLSKGQSFFDVLKRRVANTAQAGTTVTASHRQLVASADSLYTHTLFYLAQVHGHLGSSALTHRYIEATLQRQLHEQEITTATTTTTEGAEEGQAGDDDEHRAAPSLLFAVDRPEWVRNALKLSSLYCSRLQWHAAAHCLAAADVVLSQALEQAAPDAAAGATTAGDPCSHANLSSSSHAIPESLQRLYCEVAVHWAKLYTEILKTARERHAAFSNEEGGKGAKDESLFSKPWDRKWVKRQQAATSTPASAAAGNETSDDPFSTAPMPHWKSNNTTSGGSVVDEDGNMDDEEDAVLLSSTLSGSSASSSSSSSSSMGGSAGVGAEVRGPFSRFLQREGPKVSSKRYSSYGPLDVAPGLCLSGLKRTPEPSTVTSFDSAGGARDVFRALNAACTRALQFLVLDGFVTDHVDVTQLLSRAYKYLAYWEHDGKRCAAMHQRRVDLLSPLIEQLNPSIYLHLHKELAIEAGSAAQEVFELKQAIISNASFDKGAAAAGGADFAAQLRKALVGSSDAADKAIHFYGHFLRCYADPRLNDAPVDAVNKPMSPLQGASPFLGEPSVDAYLQTHFAVARVLSKRTPLAVPGKVTAHEAQITALKAAGERFGWLVKTAESGLLKPLTSLSPAVQSEVSIAKEMAALLPEKIALMTRQYQAAMGGIAAGAAGKR